MVNTIQPFSFKSEKEIFDHNNHLVYSFIRDLEEFNKKTINVLGCNNLIDIFFHEIVTLFSNAIILKNSTATYPFPPQFPYLNTDLVTGQGALNSPYIGLHTKKLVKDKRHSINRILHRFRRKKIEFSNNIPGYLIRNNLIQFFQTPITTSEEVRLYVHNAEKQIFQIQSFLTEKFKDRGIDSDMLISLFGDYIRSYLTEKEIKVSGFALLTGSNSNINSRILSANYLQNNLPVISVAHGHHSGRVFDDPVFSYAELTMSTHYIDFGSYNSQWNFNPAPKIIYRSSNKVESLISEKNSSLKSVSKEILYVPTSYSKNIFYGPYRSFEDHVYVEWQKMLLNTDENLIIKTHPKSKAPFEITENQKIEGFLEDVILNFDRFVFDYVSTAFALACGTGKPILYFDLGIRKLNNVALEIIKERCFYCKIDFERNIEEQVKEAITKFRQPFEYDPYGYSKIFSINENNTSEWDTVLKLVYKVGGG